MNLGDSVWAFLLLMAWLSLYEAVRPVKDYYVLRVNLYETFLEYPWRDDSVTTNYQGFDDYLAAKAAFDWHEALITQDSNRDEEHTLVVVSSRSKRGAISQFRSGKEIDRAILHHGTAYRMRYDYWRRFAKENPEDFNNLVQQSRAAAAKVAEARELSSKV
jgi:hypothetical protein